MLRPLVAQLQYYHLVAHCKTEVFSILLRGCTLPAHYIAELGIARIGQMWLSQK